MTTKAALSLNIFRRQLKTHFFCEILTRCTESIRDFFENALYKLTLYLLTYLLTNLLYLARNVGAIANVLHFSVHVAARRRLM